MAGPVRATGAAVALKRIRMTDPAQRDAAVSEAAVLGALDHPNLIRLHRLERVDGAIVLVLDYASAGSLAALLGARGRLTPGEVITALSPIGAALAHAHAANIVHGDVTPANVLFTDIGLPLLADLGVARLVGDTKPVHTTLPYADPIVVAGYLPDPASDVFMLGAVTLHAVTGHAPPSAAGELDPAAWQARIAALLARSEVPRADGGRDRPGAVARAAPARQRCGVRAGPAPRRHAGRARGLGRTVAGRAVAGPARGDRGGTSRARCGTTHRTPCRRRPPLTRGVRLPSPMPPARHRARGRSLALPSAILVGAAALVTAASAVAGRVAIPGIHRPRHRRPPRPHARSPVAAAQPGARPARRRRHAAGARRPGRDAGAGLRRA